MTAIGVVHLVRAENGQTPFKRFLDSYAEHDAGLRHDLIIVFKGFYSRKSLQEYKRLLQGHPHKSMSVWDWGYDVRSYFLAVKNFDYEYFCFLNSYSVILDRNWLAKMYRCCSQQGVGLVGATGTNGSWSSHISDLLNSPSPQPIYRRLMRNIWLRFQLRRYQPHFASFPNYHIRTNGFMISSNLMQKIKYPVMISKFAAYRLESGKHSLTKQIMNMNLSILVVGRDGKGYEKEEWSISNTFWQRDQGNLLIADNQTNRYMSGDNKTKQFLSRSAWGDEADPFSAKHGESHAT